MIHTKDNPKLVKDIFNFKNQTTFTGVVKDDFNNIGYYLNGKLHREDGPAMQLSNGMKEWWLNDKPYGWNNHFTNESWIRFVKLELLK